MGHNPLCGDEIDVYLQVEGAEHHHRREGGRLGLQHLAELGKSMMSQAVKGKPLAEVRALVRRFKGMMSIPDEDGNPIEPDPV